MFEVEHTHAPGGAFYPVGVFAEERDVLARRLEDMLAMVDNIIAPYAQARLDCTCMDDGWHPKIRWAYAKNLDGQLATPPRIDWSEVAKHVSGDFGEHHVVTITPNLHLRVNEL